MNERTIAWHDIAVPCFLYGTAWKEAATQPLTELAISHGFRGIDTANQRRHYDEAAVGQAIAAAFEAGSVSRDELFLQTKFTFPAGQDHRLPYDPAAPVADQVEQSFRSSLQHLRIDRVDSYLLHGPMFSAGLSREDMAAWRAMEKVQQRGQARMIGVSNFAAAQLDLLLEQADVKPAIVQNRCFAVRGWDRHVRQLCQANGILYQGFSLLTANQGALAHPVLTEIAGRHGRTIPQIVFRFAIDAGMIPLTGTTDADHMRQDLAVFGFQLKQDEVEAIENLAAP